MKFKLVNSILFLFFTTNCVKAQVDSVKLQADSVKPSSARVYFIRKTGHLGSAINFRVFMDSSVVCKLSNKHYSVLEVIPGNHTFYVTTWDSPNPKKDFGTPITIEAGKQYYLKMNIRQRFFVAEVSFDEITYNSAKPLIDKLKLDSNCDK
jgi:hypothetical protein